MKKQSDRNKNNKQDFQKTKKKTPATEPKGNEDRTTDWEQMLNCLGPH